jgi:rfaE bifunctional protein kinase chain/domain
VIAVIGDVILDKYWKGEVNRLSQEAPVPVVTLTTEEYRAGAAANVAMNCVSLGAKAILMGIVGDDGGADELGKLLQAAGVESVLLRDGSINTTQKFRLIGRNQQIARIDVEFKPNVIMCPPIPGDGPVILSDYAKGALTNVQDWIKAATGRVVIVDPKGVSYERYRGADVVKPNIDEMRAIVGGWVSESDLTGKAMNLIANAGIGALLLTRASEGMTLFDGEGVLNIPSVAREVYDVTGAGDTVVAALAVFMERGKSLREAAVLANHAAGVACSKFGTSTVSLEELEAAI